MKEQTRHDRVGAVSRRHLLKGAAALAATLPVRTRAQTSGDVLAYVAAYTNRGKGVELYRMNPSTGALTFLKGYADTPSPSALAFDPEKKYLYACNEISNFNGTTTGSVTAWKIDPANGELTFLNVKSSGGGGPAHLSVHPGGKHVLVSNYGGGNVAVLPIMSNGEVGDPTDIKAHTGPLGTLPGPLAPPGSFAISGHDAPHAHMIEADHDGNYVFSTDLGTDRTFIWKFDAANGRLNPADQPWLQGIAGSGPRHFAFHPNGNWFYVINEEDSTITFCTYDSATGKLTPQTTKTSLPTAFAGTNYASEIAVSPDGKWVYSANRLYDTITIFQIDQATGDVRRVGDEWTRGSYPRNFAIDPSGTFMHVLHSRSDNITTFRIEQGGMKLTFTGIFTASGNPSHMLFL